MSLFNPLSLIGTVADIGYNLYQTNRQEKHDYGMLNASNEFTENMWNKENEYNSPSATIQRARDAGINPNALLGNVVNPASSVASASGGSSLPTLQNVGSQAIQNATSFLTSLVQAENTSASTEKVKEETKAVGQQMRINEASLQPTINKLVNEANLTEAQAKQLRTLTPLLAGKTENEAKLIIQQVEEAKSRIELNAKQGNELDASQKLKSQEAELKRLEVNLARQGIFVSADGLSNVLNILASGNADIVGRLISELGRGLSSGIDALQPEWFKNLLDGKNPDSWKAKLKQIGDKWDEWFKPKE